MPQLIKNLPPKHISPQFSVGEWVFPKADPEQQPRIVTGIVIRSNDRIHILASNYDNEREYDQFELSHRKTKLP